MRGVLAATMVSVLAVLTGCAPDASGGETVLRVAYREQPPSSVRSDLVHRAAERFEAEHPGIRVEPVPINAVDDDYHVKIALMQRSRATAPHVVLLDSFRVAAQAGAGSLAPLDEALTRWEDWTTEFVDSARELAVVEGRTYGVPVTGGAIGLWYDKLLLERAGVPMPWVPQTWSDVIETASAVRAAAPDVVPFGAQMTKAGGEGTAMQTLEVLLQGTPGGLGATLADPSTASWITGSQGFIDALEFLDRLRTHDLAPSELELQDPNLGRLLSSWFREHRVAIALTGNWLSGPWQQPGAAGWPNWSDEVGWTAMPTIDGAAPGATSMTGGWVWSVGSASDDAAAAFELVTMLADRASSLEYALGTGDMPVRSDVAADPALRANPAMSDFFDLLEVAGIRPASEQYPQVSVAMQRAAEAVATGAKTPRQAAERYDADVRRIAAEGRRR